MDTRQQTVLKNIVITYTKTGQPVGSKTLAQAKNFDYSAATIRNDMAELEQENYISHPHTSAGRVPTIKGLQYFIDHLLTPRPLTDREITHLKSIFNTDGLRGLARMAAQYCQSAAFLVTDRDNMYYTGFSFLFAHPDLSDVSYIRSISTAVDRIEKALPAFLADRPGSEPKIYIGRKNPLGDNCCTMGISSEDEKFDRFLGIIGPLRTDYPRAVGVLKAVTKYLNHVTS